MSQHGASALAACSGMARVSSQHSRVLRVLAFSGCLRVCPSGGSAPAQHLGVLFLCSSRVESTCAVAVLRHGTVRCSKNGGK